MAIDIPLCECGCGETVGLYRGVPNRFVRYHHMRLDRPNRIMRRIWEHVDRRDPDECWPWTGPIAQDGYGHVSTKKTFDTWIAHRVVYSLLVGPIPEGLQLDHLCRNRSCVNPAHLEPVTARENTLRGDTAAARNIRKTHCPKGHPYAGDNLSHKPDGSRRCRQCNREYARAQRALHQ